MADSKISLTESKWRALVMEVGALGSLTGISTIVASCIAPLANCGVSVFCLSTNLDDFVLVSEQSLQTSLKGGIGWWRCSLGSQCNEDVLVVHHTWLKVWYWRWGVCV